MQIDLAIIDENGDFKDSMEVISQARLILQNLHLRVYNTFKEFNFAEKLKDAETKKLITQQLNKIKLDFNMWNVSDAILKDLNIVIKDSDVDSYTILLEINLVTNSGTEIKFNQILKKELK